MHYFDKVVYKIIVRECPLSISHRNGMFGNIENNFSPSKFSPDDRDNWVEELG